MEYIQQKFGLRPTTKIYYTKVSVSLNFSYTHKRYKTLTTSCTNLTICFCPNPTLAKCGGEAQHLEKLEVWSPPGLPNVQSSTERPKTPRIEVFLVSLERSWNRPLKVENRPLLDVASRSATWCWKALDKNYNFGSQLVPIQAQGEELWLSKVPGLQLETVSGLQLGSLGKKSHSDVASAVRRRE
jgi:hypothetical protein